MAFRTVFAIFQSGGSVHSSIKIQALVGHYVQGQSRTVLKYDSSLIATAKRTGPGRFGLPQYRYHSTSNPPSIADNRGFHSPIIICEPSKPTQPPTRYRHRPYPDNYTVC